MSGRESNIYVNCGRLTEIEETLPTNTRVGGLTEIELDEAFIPPSERGVFELSKLVVGSSGSRGRIFNLPNYRQMAIGTILKRYCSNEGAK